MDVYRTINPAQFRDLVSRIRHESGMWNAIDIVVEKGGVDIQRVATQVEAYFGVWNGAIFIFGADKLLVLAHKGSKTEIITLKQGLLDRMPDAAFTVTGGPLTKEGLRTIEVRLQELPPKQEPLPVVDFSARRAARDGKIFLVVDDDMFMRSVLAKVLVGHGQVVELADGAELVSTYARLAPDALFLDIHLPSGSGMNYLNDIVALDPAAGIIMLSADSIKDNILAARNHGACAFLAKPFTRERVEDSMRKCILPG
jgi:two-component system, chemotaxis family, chemotaxis protein CheY